MSGIILAHRAAFHGGIALPSIGESFMGGYYAGIIDTTKGNIIAADYFQTGSRYALICGAKAIESSSAYKTSNDAAVPQSWTRWNGLGATAAMNSSTYPAAQYCYGITPPTDSASRWYLPALDELELIYRNLKPTTDNNTTGTRTGGTFIASQDYGYNPSSDPPAAAYTISTPAQTAVTAFKAGGAQAFGGGQYRCVTEYNTTFFWTEFFDDASSVGYQAPTGKTGVGPVRPVRRLVLA